MTNARRKISVGTAPAKPKKDQTHSSDRLTLTAKNWFVLHAELNSMVLEWQGLESKLSDKARTLRMNFSQACRSNLPEAKAMRTLDESIESKQLTLVQNQRQVMAIGATTLIGALAKLEVGLKVQGQLGWQSNAQELVEEGLAELRKLSRDRK